MNVAGRRRLGALVVAVVIHGGVVLGIRDREVVQRFLPAERLPVTVEFATPPTPPAPEREPPPKKTPARPTPTTTPALPTTTAPAEPTTEPLATAPPTTLPADEPRSLMRIPGGLSHLEAVLGAGGPLGASQDALAGALDIKVDAPVKDSLAAARNATRQLQDDLADDAVSAGLADDYFRELTDHVRAAWQPAIKELNDGGASTTQMGMMKGIVDDRAAWGEMWLAYMDLAQQYANGVQPRLETQRIERLRELFRSRKGAFRVQAIAEVKLTIDPTGKVQLLEFTTTSGHPGVDAGIGAAIALAVIAMPEAPPPRLHHGRSFTSSWRLRATWSMVPPTAFFSGTSFDITNKGFTADVPFQIKLNTNVLLMRTDVRSGAR